MTGAFHVAWQYLRFHRLKTTLLVLAIALIAFVPAGLNVVVGESASQLRARAEATPLLLGAPGSPFELALSSLYFETRAPEPVPFGELERVRATGLGGAIPLHLGFRAAGHPIVGTELGYFAFRGLRIARGRMLAVLGECVLGAEVARLLDAGPGDALVSSPEVLFDLAGSYPLKMRVAGVLARAHTPDDRAVFVDVKTSWVIAGLGHGHRDLGEPGAAASVLRREAGPSGERIVANAAVREYNEITAENAASFHFHGEAAGYPITALIAVPPSEKERALLLGRYAAPGEALQALRPAAVIDDLLGTVFAVRGYVIAALAVVGAATVITAALVFALSLRLRQREIETLHKIGAARTSVAIVLGAEVVAVLLMAAILAGLLTLATRELGGAAIRSLLLT